MAEFTLKGRGDTRDIEQALQKAGLSMEQLEKAQQKAQASARELAKGIGLTSKETSAAAKVYGVTGSELKKLIKNEQIAASEARHFAQAQQEAAAKSRGLKQAANDAADGIQTLTLMQAAEWAANAARAVVDLGVELYNTGAAADRFTQSLDIMTGAQADVYVEAIQAASKGTIDEMNALTIANRAAKFEIAANSEEMALLTQVAVAMGRTMGQDAVKSFDDLTTASARQSKMIADNLGIIVDMDRVTRDAAAAMEMDRSLTEDDARARAFLNQIVEAGITPQMQAVLAQHDAAEGAEQLAANLQDLKGTGGGVISDFLQPFVDLLNATIGSANALVDVVESQNAEIARSSDSFEEYLTKLAEAERLDAKLIAATRDQTGVQKVLTQSLVAQATVALPLVIQQLMGLEEEYYRVKSAQDLVTDGSAATAAAAQAEGIAHHEKMIRIAQGLEEWGTAEERGRQMLEERAKAEREAEQAARAYEQALRDQQREHEALAALVGRVNDEVGRVGSQAWMDNATAGESYLDFLKAAGIDLANFPGAYDAILQQGGILTEQQLAQKRGFEALGDAIDAGLVDPIAGLDLYTAFASGAVGVDEFKAKLDELERFKFFEDIGVDASDGLTELEDKLIQTASKAQSTADESEGAFEDLTGAIGEVSEAAEALGVDAGPAFGKVDTAARNAIAGVNALADEVGRLWSNLLGVKANANISINITGGGDHVGGGGVSGSRAEGGPVTAGSTYLVGERGPELFTPSTSGNITPNGAMGGTFNFNGNLIINPPAGTSESAIADMVIAKLSDVERRARRGGAAYAGAF